MVVLKDNPHLRGGVAHLALLLMTLALLLPVYGPWLDGAYAGRQPTHQHLYFGAIQPDHPHGRPAEPPYPRHHFCDAATGHPCAWQLSGVVNLPDQDATGQGFLTPLYPGHVALLPAAALGELSWTAAEQLFLRPGRSVAPLEQPPRA